MRVILKSSLFPGSTFVRIFTALSPLSPPCLSFLLQQDLNELDHLHWNQDDTYDLGGAHVIIKEGYGALSAKVAETLDIRLNTEVKSIKLLDDAASCVEVVMQSNGKSTMMRAGYVVVTLPLGVLKSRLVSAVPGGWNYLCTRRPPFRPPSSPRFACYPCSVFPCLQSLWEVPRFIQRDNASFRGQLLPIGEKCTKKIISSAGFIRFVI